jgi:hypothetical protein
VISSLIRLAAVLVCCSFAATPLVAASFAQSGAGDRGVTREQQPRPPRELWERFPLGKPTLQPAAPQSAQPPAPPLELPGFESGGEELSSGELLRILLLLAGLSLVVLLGPAVFILVRPRRPARAAAAAGARSAVGPQRHPGADTSHERSAYVALQRVRLLGAMRRPGAARERVQAARALAIEAVGWDMVSSQNPEGRQEPVEEKIVRPAVEGGDRGQPPVRDDVVREKPAPSDYMQFGDRVAAVLRAAEEAAEQIRADARAAAEQTTRRAEQDATTRLEEARREAEAQAARLLSDAETQARASREAAEAMVQRIQESARSLEEELGEQERMIRGRMQRYLAALTDVSGRIEAVLGEPKRRDPLVGALNAESASRRE